MSYMLPFTLTDMFAKLLGFPGGLRQAAGLSTSTLGLPNVPPVILSALGVPNGGVNGEDKGNGRFDFTPVTTAALIAILGSIAMGSAAAVGFARELSHTRITVREEIPGEQQSRGLLNNKQVEKIVAGLALGGLLLGTQLLPQTRAGAEGTFQLPVGGGGGPTGGIVGGGGTGGNGGGNGGGGGEVTVEF